MVIGFIGLGNMASAMVRGIEAAQLEGVTLCGHNPHPEKAKELAEQCGLRLLPSNQAVLDASDVVVLAGCLSILGPSVIAAYPKRSLNVLPSLIPSFCGAGYYGLRVHEAARAKGVKVTGATVHFVNEIPDGGEILLQKAVEIAPDATPETLQRRVMEQAEWQMLPLAAERVCAEIVREKEQKND